MTLRSDSFSFCFNRKWGRVPWNTPHRVTDSFPFSLCNTFLPHSKPKKIGSSSTIDKRVCFVCIWLCIHSEYCRVSKHREMLRNFDELFSVEEIRTIRHGWRLKLLCKLFIPSARNSWWSKCWICTPKGQLYIFQSWHSQTNPTYPVTKHDMTSWLYLRYIQSVFTFMKV